MRSLTKKGKQNNLTNCEKIPAAIVDGVVAAFDLAFAEQKGYVVIGPSSASSIFQS